MYSRVRNLYLFRLDWDVMTTEASPAFRRQSKLPTEAGSTSFSPAIDAILCLAPIELGHEARSA
jgi:hypothetical protein